MKISVLFGLLLSLLSASAVAAPAAKIKVLVLTGGHGFKAEPFFKIFADNPEI